MKHAAVKRCPTSGSCNSPNKCGDVTYKSKVEEIGQPANSRPGFTYCAESCSAFPCGCFWLTYACLYYRTYAVPESDTAFEVFSCPMWHYHLSATVRLIQQGTMDSHELELLPGIEAAWNKIRLTLITVNTPPASILTTKFMTDGSRTVVTEASASGQPVVGQVGSLQCATLSSANAFNCSLPGDPCNCQPQDHAVSCTCIHGKLEPLFDGEENVIPLCRVSCLLRTGEPFIPVIPDRRDIIHRD